MPTIYDSNKIIPSPLMSINKVYQTSQDGTKLGSLFEIKLVGKITAFKGSPDSNGTFWTAADYPPDETLTQDERLKAILKKQEALRKLFSDEGKLLEIQPWDGSAPIKCNPRVKSIEFSEAIWFEVCDYVITLEADLIYGPINPDGEDIEFDDKIAEAAENWQIEASDVIGQYRLTHNISAKGKRFYDEMGDLVKPAWQHAQNYVQNSIGLGLDDSRLIASGVLNLYVVYGAYNYVRGETVNELDGTYAVTESWIINSGSYYEQFTITARTAEDNAITTVNVDGTIFGLETRNNVDYGLIENRYTAALAGYNSISNGLLTRAQSYTGVTLHPHPIETTVARNPLQGTISYGMTWSSRCSGLVDGARSEVITITDNNNSDIIAKIPILGRTQGVLLQDPDAGTGHTRELNIELKMGACTIAGGQPVQPNTDNVLLTYQPAGSFVYQTQDTVTWSPSTGSYSRRTVWDWEP